MDGPKVYFNFDINQLSQKIVYPVRIALCLTKAIVNQFLYLSNQRYFFIQDISNLNQTLATFDYQLLNISKWLMFSHLLFSQSQQHLTNGLHFKSILLQIPYPFLQFNSHFTTNLSTGLMTADASKMQIANHLQTSSKREKVLNSQYVQKKWHILLVQDIQNFIVFILVHRENSTAKMSLPDATKPQHQGNFPISLL